MPDDVAHFDTQGNGAGEGGKRNGEQAAASVEGSVETATVKSTKSFLDALKDPDSELSKRVGNPPRLSGVATNKLDGRRVGVVLAVVRDEVGKTSDGLLVRLLGSKDELLDQSRTDRSGLAVLRFPLSADPAATRTGMLEVLGADKPLRRPIEIARGVQHSVAELVVKKLPAPGEVVGLGDDPFERLPADFTPGLADAIATLRGGTPDPIFSRVAGASDDFRARKRPLIKRLNVVRLGTERNGKIPQYLVRLRQEWQFIGYTLGEVASVESLDPGTVIQETTETLQRAVERVSREVDQVVSRMTEDVTSSLRQAASIDTVISVAASTRAYAAAGGFGLALGPLVIGGGGGVAGTTTSARTETNVDTSLQVNSSLHVAKSALNEATRSALSTVRQVESTVATSIGRVSPLLSRVTNLLRWTLYENYVVTTQVEDVVELFAQNVLDRGDGSMPVFTDEDIVEYRPFFEPVLLEPRLANQFAVLAEAVARRLAAGLPITAVHVEINFAAPVFGATLVVTIQGRDATLQLPPGATRARASLQLLHPISPAKIGDAKLVLSLGSAPEVSIFGMPLTEAIWRSVGARVSRIRFQYETGEGISSPFSHDFDGFEATGASPTATTSVALDVPAPAPFTHINRLFRHINRNSSYYLGVLVQAAFAVPGLREDAPQLQGIPSQLWKLPIVGFEGDDIVVMKDPEGGQENPDVKRFMADLGAATVIQLAAPGAYSEALQGLLSLADAEGLIHPALQMPPPPAMPPLALVDLAGRQVPVVPSNEKTTPDGEAIDKITDVVDKSKVTDVTDKGTGGVLGKGGLL